MHYSRCSLDYPGVGIAGAAATLWDIGGHPEVVQGKEYIRGSQSGRHETT